MDNNLPCPYCSANQGFIYVQSHYQCLSCKRVVDDCCNGEVVSEKINIKCNAKVTENY
jgi:hypothetical protein